ncbi:MAG: hypothetical protein OHK0046_33970 [Anaerolineae bacterium]
MALPAEHGAWGFLLEPIALGLLLAFSPSAILLSLAMLAAFLVHQPLKITLKDLAKQRFTPRTAIAMRFALLYGGTALICLVPVILVNGTAFLLPLLLASPLIFVQQRHDVRNQSRTLAAEMSGSLALGATAAALVMLSDWAWAASLLLWGILALRTITSILYVRGKLRLERDKPVQWRGIVAAHALALVLAAAWVVANVVPLSVLLGVLLLTMRAIHGLQARRNVKAARVGVGEMLIGLLYIVLVALGYAL